MNRHALYTIYWYARKHTNAKMLKGIEALLLLEFHRKPLTGQLTPTRSLNDLREIYNSGAELKVLGYTKSMELKTAMRTLMTQMAGIFLCLREIHEGKAEQDGDNAMDSWGQAFLES